MYLDIIRATLALILLTPFIHATLPPPAYPNGFYVDWIAGEIQGVYPHGATGVRDIDISWLAPRVHHNAITVVDNVNRAAAKLIPPKNSIPYPAGMTIYKSGSGDLVIAPIGAGTRKHGEQNIQDICRNHHIAFEGGESFTWTAKEGFIPACPDPSSSGGNGGNRNCLKLLSDNFIKDGGKRLTAGHRRSVSF